MSAYTAKMIKNNLFLKDYVKNEENTELELIGTEDKKKAMFLTDYHKNALIHELKRFGKEKEVEILEL
ncbi:MAG: hypothetical protein ACRCXX_07225 [Cetobacterium sp.]|uniref:hypothetical protein n=1 Tax=Cetobacterium sp. TaxID=2071632 RepID=UPI003F3EAEE8